MKTFIPSGYSSNQGPSESGTADVPRTSSWRRFSALFLIVVYLFSPQSGMAQTVAAAVSAENRPDVGGTDSLPIINIAPPNGSGISHNQYQSFNVPTQGMVLNNSTTATTSHLAGALAANPRLTTSARIILNEVTGNTPSALLGPTEIAGAPARLVLANPNGITCSGCGFINTPFVQLTTGEPGYESDGSLSFDVAKGTIAIEPGGLAALAQRLDLIGQNISVNGPISNSGQLNLVAGNHVMQADGLVLTEKTFSDSETVYGIDVSQSLNAGTIRLIDSARYYYDILSIRATAPLTATEDVVISGAGRTHLADISAGRDVVVSNIKNGSRLELKGQVTAGNDLQVSTQMLRVQSQATLSAGRDLQLGLVADNSDGWVEFSNRGTLAAGRDLVLAATGSISGGNYGRMQADRDLDLLGTVFISSLLAGTPGIVKHDSGMGSVDTEEHDLVSPLDAYDGRPIHNFGGILNAGQDVRLRYGENPDGRVEAGRDLYLVHPDDFPSNDRDYPRAGGVYQATRDLHLLNLPSQNYLACQDCRYGPAPDRFLAGRNALLKAVDPVWNSHWQQEIAVNPHNIRAEGDIIGEFDRPLVNLSQLSAGGNVFLTAPAITNTAGLTWPEPTVYRDERYSGCRVDSGGTCTAIEQIQTATARISSGQNMVLDTGRLDNLGGAIAAAGNLTITTDQLENHDKEVFADWRSVYYSWFGMFKREHTASGRVKTAHIPSSIEAGGRLVIAGQVIQEPAPPVQAPQPGTDGSSQPSQPSQPVPLADHVHNTALIQGGSVVIAAHTLLNGIDFADRQRQLDQTGTTIETLDGGVIASYSDMSLVGRTIDNTGFLLAGGTLAVDADTLYNRKRNAAYYDRQYVSGGYIDIWGDTVQPGGYMQAANWQLNLQRVVSVSGEFKVADPDPQVALQESLELEKAMMAALGAQYEASQTENHLQQRFTKKKKGLKGLLAAVVAVVVSIYTFGAASAAIASAAGATGTAAATSAWAVGGVANTVAASAASGMAASAAGQVVATGRIDFNQVLRAGVTAALTAGLLNAPVLENGQSLNSLANVQTVSGQLSTATFNPDTFGSNLLAMTGRAMVSAGVNSAIYGGSFGDALKHNLLADLAAVGANAIGQTWGDGQNPGMQVVAHAGLGCAAAAAGGNDCASGAIGGAGAALFNPLFDGWIAGDDGLGWGSDLNRQAGLTGLSMLSTGLAAYATGQDALTAAGAAQNETLNNYLTREQIARKRAALEAESDARKRAAVESYYSELDQKQRAKAHACLLGGSCPSVMETVHLKAVLEELHAACAQPGSCSADEIKSILELRDFYGKRQAIEPFVEVEKLLTEFAAVGAVVKAGGWAFQSVLARITAAPQVRPVLAGADDAVKIGTSVSPIVPGGGLAAHEAAGGHLLLKHVGQSESTLATRLAAEPRIPAASTFLSRSEAEAAVSTVLDVRATEVAAWVASGARGQLVLNAPFSGGLVLQRGASTGTIGSGATVVLRGTGGGKWRIHTGYPTP